METKIYYYSLFMGWVGVLLFGSLGIGILYPAFLVHDSHIWLYITPVELIAGVLLYYAIKISFIPAINKEPILELDDEKLYFYMTDRTIYWRDVVEIFEDYRSHSPAIRFEMVDGSDDIIIGTKWISGRNEKIYNTIQEYFAENLRKG